MSEPVVARFTLTRPRPEAAVGAMTLSEWGWRVLGGDDYPVLCPPAARVLLGVSRESFRLLVEVSQGVRPVAVTRTVRIVSEPDDEDGSDVLWWRDPENEDATLDECYPEARRVLEAAGFRTVEPFHVTILEQSP